MATFLRSISQQFSKTAFLILLILGVFQPSGAAQAKWVTAFYPGYQQNLMPPESIDFSVLTHLVVGMVFPKEDGTLDYLFMADDVAGEAFAKNLVERAHSKGKKALMMLGGAGANKFPQAMSDQNRSRFVQEVVTNAKRLGFDGIDLDFEDCLEVMADDDPWCPKAVKGPVYNYGLALKFIKQFRNAWPRGIITYDAFWKNRNFPDDVHPDLIEIAKSVHQFNLMTYGMADSWDGWKSWHSSALFDDQPSYPSSIKSTVDIYLNKGAPANKIGIGIGAYGSCWGAPVTGPRQDPQGSGVIASDNDMSYANILSRYYKTPNYHYDMEAEAPFLSYSKPYGDNSCTFISYEDRRSIAAKGAYVRAQGLGGAILWTLPEAYRLGATKPNDLLYSIRDAFRTKPVWNRKPTAALVVDLKSGNTPLPVNFNASQSYDPDGDKLTFDWDFGDGHTGQGQEIHHDFANASNAIQSFTVVLTVSDGELTAQTIQIIKVDPPGVVTLMPPRNLQAKTVGQNVRLKWEDKSYNEDAFSIERAPWGTLTFKQVGLVAADSTSHVDIPPAGHYAYRVRAYKSSANKYSSPSNRVEVVATGLPLADLVLYRDGKIPDGWQADAWNYCNNWDLLDTLNVYPGHTYSYRFTESCVWGGAGFMLTDPDAEKFLDQEAYGKLSFDINAGDNVDALQHVYVLLANDSLVPKLSNYLPLNPQPNTWIHVEIPMSDLNSKHLPYRFVFFQTDTDESIVFNLDNVLLSNAP